MKIISTRWEAQLSNKCLSSWPRSSGKANGGAAKADCGIHQVSYDTSELLRHFRRKNQDCIVRYVTLLLCCLS